MVLLLVILLGLNYFKYNSKVNKCEMYIYSVIQWHMILLGVLYVLSAVKKFNNIFVVISIVLVDIMLIFFLAKSYKNNRFSFDIIRIRSWINQKIKCRYVYYYLVPVIMFMVVLYITINTVPYNYDSMTYHLPRIAHWAQNQSVIPYASNIDRQIGSTRIASYICLYLYTIAGKTDVLVNYVQCFS